MFVPTGKWITSVYGNMEITRNDIAEFVEHFKPNVRNVLPITAGHANGMNGGELPGNSSSKLWLCTLLAIDSKTLRNRKCS